MFTLPVTALEFSLNRLGLFEPHKQIVLPLANFSTVPPISFPTLSGVEQGRFTEVNNILQI